MMINGKNLSMCLDKTGEQFRLRLGTFDRGTGPHRRTFMLGCRREPALRRAAMIQALWNANGKAWTEEALAQAREIAKGKKDQ